MGEGETVAAGVGEGEVIGALVGLPAAGLPAGGFEEPAGGLAEPDVELHEPRIDAPGTAKPTRSRPRLVSCGLLGWAPLLGDSVDVEDALY